MENEFNFKPFDKVLVRDSHIGHWEISFYSRYIGENHEFPHKCTGSCYKYCIPYNNETAHLLGTTEAYVEPWTPKDGDFVVSGWEKGDKYCRWIAICRGYDNDESLYQTYAILHVCYSSDNGIKEPLEVKYDVCDGQDYTRLATEEEKQLFLSKLAETGKKWNPDKKCIEDYYQPKDGDFVFYHFSNDDYISIYNTSTPDGFYARLSLTHKTLLYNNSCIDTYIERRPATDSEKQQLLDALHEAGKDWNAEKKKIVEYRWRPKEKEYYWTIYGDGSIDRICKATESDAMHIKIGNCFRTKEEAQAMADKVKELFKRK